MKRDYEWYFWQNEDVASITWDTGVLTVDANVLLDLYRYHESTREELLTCLETFRDRIWISRQAADEFFRNRAKVIVSASKEYLSAEKDLDGLSQSLSASVEKLSGNRIIDRVLCEELDRECTDAIDKAKAKLREIKDSHPQFLNSDPVLARLVSLFDGRVGEAFSPDNLTELTRIGEERKDNQVPPGYLDDNKEGSKPLGDFFLWRQVLDYAKRNNKHVILVTSERKEDWWEKHSGKIVGPRQELQREASEYSEQRVLIYQTTRFLQLTAEKTGRDINDAAVDEIRAVDESRPDSIPIVKLLSQEVARCGLAASDGTLTVEILRPTYTFTATGHFEPILSSSPALSIRLIESPEPMPSYRMSAGSGTRHDFNVHIKSTDYGVYLPLGIYKFAYSARSVAVQTEEDEDTGGREI